VAGETLIVERRGASGDDFWTWREAMYALAAVILAVAMPESTRPANSHARLGASAMMT